MHGTHFVPGVISLNITQIYVAPLHLAPRGLSLMDIPTATAAAALLLGRCGPGGGRPGFGSESSVLEVDFAAEFEAVEWGGGGVVVVGWGGGATSRVSSSERSRAHFP